MPKKIRTIARLDIKAPYLIKGVHLEGLRKLGDPHEFALDYYQQGIDEIMYMDAVASLYGRNNILDLVSQTTKNIFIPIVVGGGIRCVDDAQDAFLAGADKIAINSAALKKPELISDLARRFGKQAVVVSIEAKLHGINNGWEAYSDNGREHSGVDVLAWAKQAVALGAGEILLTSIDQEGTGKGFDIALIQQVSRAVSVPVIASGGMGCHEDMLDAVLNGCADAVAMANILHYKRSSVQQIKQYAQQHDIEVRL